MKKNEFDTLLKELQLSSGSSKSDFGYKIESRNYETYYSKDAFESFCSKMKSKHPDYYSQYDDGKGGEFIEHSSRYGLIPPKMACVASSSRFCYLAFSEVYQPGEVEFEKGCPIKGVSGNAPQLDAYIKPTNTYVEVKCHEIYDSHTVTMKVKYWNKIYGIDNDFGFPQNPVAPSESDKEFTIPTEQFGLTKKHTMFDIKQLLCHLMGIASLENKKAELMYLFFKPSCDNESDQDRVDSDFDKLTEEINAIFCSKPIKNFCSKYNITLKAVAEVSNVMISLTADNTLVLYNQNAE